VSFLPTGETPSTGGHPYSTATDAEPMNSVLLVLSCGSEGCGAESGYEKETRWPL